jgi:hypothetical protein
MAILAPARVANGASPRAATGLTSTVQARGMEMSFSIPPGPYFLGEMLRTSASLANFSGKPIAYERAPWNVYCSGGPIAVALSGGVPPLFDLGLNLCEFASGGAGPSCEPGYPNYTNGTLISKGQRITVHPLVVLTASGTVTLTAWVTFIACTLRNHVLLMTQGTGPFGSALPAFQVTVAPKAPANKVLHQVRTGTQVSIQAPYRNLPGVMTNWEQDCVEPNPTAIQQGLMGRTGSLGWIPMVNNTLVDPLCPSGHGKLIVAVGAPGFGIDKEVYCQNPLDVRGFNIDTPPCTHIVH